ncbi:MAG TPA: hypothetical protein VFG04_08980 [Planctomycetaceae bacterium]|nr:hypothetical protein [Planctomycetaceae bacterium]
MAADAPRRVPDRAYALLESIERKTQHVGQNVDLDEPELTAASFARNFEEVFYFVRHLKETGRIEGELFQSGGGSFRVTPTGFEELEGRRRSNLDSEKAFVAMSFDDSLTAAWLTGIKPAIEAAGFDALRIDWDEHNEDINNRIKARIRESRFIVADCTLHRNGVYFEAGFAMGLGLPVIWLCRKDEFNKTHFDANHYRYTLWDKPEDICKPLEDRIVGTIGAGPLRGRRP